MTYPFAEVVHDGSSWMVFVGGKALDGNPFKGISWKSKVEIINSAHEARVKEAVREAVAERDARTAELERVLAIAENSILECRGGLRVCDGLLGGRLNLMGAIESAGKALAEIKSVLGKGE